MISEYDKDLWTIRAMKKSGGSFVKALGEAALLADDINRKKIKVTFYEYWRRYELIGEDMRKNGEEL